jgi:hypothetical protein
MTSIQEALTVSLENKGLSVKKNGNGKNGHAANGALSNVAKTVPVPPTKKRFSFKGLNVPRVGVLIQSAEERQQALAEFAQFKSAVAESMAECVGQLRQIENMEEAERNINAGAYTSLKNAVAEMLSYGEPAARDISVLEYAKVEVLTCPEFGNMVGAMLNEFVTIGFLSSSDSTGGRGVRVGEIRFYNKIYSLTGPFTKNVEAQAVLVDIVDLIHRTAEAGKRRFEADLIAVKTGAGENPLSVADLKAGKPGRIALEVPEQLHQGRVLKGGWILVESVDRKVYVVDAAGYIQRKADEMRVGQPTFVYADQIGREKLELATQLPEEAFNKVFVLWKWLSTACKVAEYRANAAALAQKWTEQVTAERATLEPLATLAAEEFFLVGKLGTFFYDFGAGQVFNWHIKVEGSTTGKVVNIPDVFCLVERDEQGRIRVADCPERLKLFFAEHREAIEPGDKMYGLGKLGALLRIGYAKASQAAHKAGRKVERVTLADVTAEIAAAVGVDPSTLELPESNEDREARLYANSIEPSLDAPKLGRSRPAHASAATAQ